MTPNWTLDLPGSPYAGDDPEGHVPRDEIVGYLERYAAGQVREGVDVSSIRPGRDALLHLETSEGPLDASAVVVCTGAYQKPHRPPVAAGFPESVAVLDATQYRNPDQLPPGRILVVGSGQTGVQLAEELHLAGRDPVLACGRAPWAPRRIGSRDLVTVLTEAGFYDQPRSVLTSPQSRLVANVQATGLVRFADDLAQSVASATRGTRTCVGSCGTGWARSPTTFPTRSRSRARPPSRSRSPRWAP